MNFSEWQQIASSTQLGQVEEAQPLSENNHYQCWQLTTDSGYYFVKTTLKRYLPLLKAEANSLTTIAQTQTLGCPQVVAQGETVKTAWLILEWMTLKQVGNQAQLGQQLAALHRHTASQFGWSETNFIEQGIQYNHPLDDWTSFYRSQRLMPQLRRAKDNGLAQTIIQALERLIDHLEDCFIDYQPLPSLLHGNFSRDNWGFLEDSSPIVFNPSCSYGDREMDIAMSELSGGCSREFYDAYKTVYPLVQGYEVRSPIYQLYYLLNQFNCHSGNHAQQIKMLLNNL